MEIKLEIKKCPECPFYGNRYEFMKWTSYCKHEKAPKEIDYEAAYNNVGNDRLPKDTISGRCPLK